MMKRLVHGCFFAMLWGSIALWAAPGSPELHLSYRDGCPVLQWQSPPLLNPEKIRAFRLYRSTAPDQKGELLQELPKVRSRWQEFQDQWNGRRIAYYRLTAVSADGEEGKPSSVKTASCLPDLSLGEGCTVAENPQLSVSCMYPSCGETVVFRVQIRNAGAVSSAPGRLLVHDSQKRLICECPFSCIPSQEQQTVTFSYTPEKAGEYTLFLALDGAEKTEDGRPEDNQLVLQAAAGKRRIHFLWYGNPLQLKHASVGQCPPSDAAEWRRRGGWALAGVGTGENALEEYRKIAMAGEYDGISIDEISLFTEGAQRMVQALPQLKKEFPQFKVVLWTIGEDTVPQIADLVKRNIVDLLLFEVYIRPGDSLTPLYKAIDNIRGRGIAEKSLIGLVTHRDWSNWKSPAEQAQSVIGQMAIIRERAPEIPGVAFWSDEAQPGVLEAVDKACYQLFFLNKNGDNQ